MKRYWISTRWETPDGKAHYFGAELETKKPRNRVAATVYRAMKREAATQWGDVRLLSMSVCGG